MNAGKRYNLSSPQCTRICIFYDSFYPSFQSLNDYEDDGNGKFCTTQILLPYFNIKYPRKSSNIFAYISTYWISFGLLPDSFRLHFHFRIWIWISTRDFGNTLMIAFVHPYITGRSAEPTGNVIYPFLSSKSN